VIERLLAVARRFDEDRELPANLLLAHVFREGFRAQRALEGLFLRRGRRGGDQALGFNGHALSYPRRFACTSAACPHVV
jgi:hypothetical protein